MGAYIGKCRNGHAVRATAEQVNQGGGWVSCGCGQQVAPRAIKTTTSTRECNGVCTSATGPNCSCQCRGENHGAAKIYQPNN